MYWYIVFQKRHLYDVCNKDIKNINCGFDHNKELYDERFENGFKPFRLNLTYKNIN